jgi:uncharacterized membrane protein
MPRVSTVEESIEVEAPVWKVYNQWTQFEEFPKFMGGVESIHQLSSARMIWKTKIAGVEREFEAEVVEQTADQRVAWQTLEGDTPRHAGVVSFHRISDDKTRVMLQMDYDTEGFVEFAGDKLGIIKRQVTGDLERFKEFIEGRETETGAWRGEIQRPPAGDDPYVQG